MRGLLSLLLSFSLLVLTVSAQSEKKNPPSVDDDEILKINTQLVDVPIVVKDKTGKPIPGLRQENFDIFEDGKKQEIAEFITTNAPFEVALLLDTSGSTRADLRLIKRSAAMFINSLRPGDRVSIISFNSKIEDGSSYAFSEVLTPLTEDRKSLESALARVRTSNGTPFYDGLLQVVEKVFQNRKNNVGRRALVALTDGVDSTSDAGFEEVKETLNKSGVTSYFIRINTRDEFEQNILGDCQTATHFSNAQIRRYYRTISNNARLEKVYDFCKIGDFERLAMSKQFYKIAETEMTTLAKTSGGKVFSAESIREARTAFQKVATEIGTKYSLGYYSTNEKRDGKFRQIRVQPKNLPPGTQIRAREGYKAPVR
jgi:Ca-activated chloride channel family protein